MHACDLCGNCAGVVSEIYDPFAKASHWVCSECTDARSDVQVTDHYEELGKELFGEEFRLPTVEILGKMFELMDERRKV